MKFRRGIYTLILVCISVNIKAQSTERTILITELIDSALAKNFALQNAKLNLAFTRLQRNEVRSVFIPHISASGTYAYGNMGIHGLSLPIHFPASLVELGAAMQQQMQLAENPIPAVYEMELNLDFEGINLFTAGINAEMVLFTGLKAYHTDKALQFKYKAEEALESRQESEVIKELFQYYDRLSLVQQTEKVLYESRLRLDKEIQRARKAFEQGLASNYDVEKVEIANLDLKSRELELCGKRKIIARRLHQLTGLPLAHFLQGTIEITPLFIVVGESEFQNRYELDALKQRSIANEYMLKAANSGYLPKVAAMGTYQYMDMDIAKADPIAFVGVGVSWNLFDGLETRIEKQKARIEIEKSQNEYNEALERSQLSIESAQVAYEVNLARIELFREQKERSMLALRIKSREYEEGLAEINARLEAEADYQKAQLDFIQSVYDQRLACLQLMEAAGKLNAEEIRKITTK